MMKVARVLALGRAFEPAVGEPIIVIPDENGKDGSRVVLQIRDINFRIGSIGVDAKISTTASATILVDEVRSSAYILLVEGLAFVVGIEDQNLLWSSEGLIVYSESGIMVLSEKKRREINFARLPEYIIDFDFKDVANGNVSYETGDYRQVTWSISALDDLFGVDLAQTPTRVGRIEEGDTIYSIAVIQQTPVG